MLEKEDCMQALSGQIFMGMVSSQYQARLDIVRLIDGLVNACIRFVYFSLEDELKSKVGEPSPAAPQTLFAAAFWAHCSLPSASCRCLPKRWAWRRAGIATSPSRPTATCPALRSPPPAPATLAPCMMT